MDRQQFGQPFGGDADPDGFGTRDSVFADARARPDVARRESTNPVAESAISFAVRNPAVSSASCSSSASRGSGRASSRTRSIAAASSAPRSLPLGSAARRVCTACVRRSSSGASSRNAYGFALRISCASGDGSGVSRATQRISPAWMRVEHARQAVEVHRLFEAVAHGLVDERMIGDLAIAGDVLEARGGVGEDGGHQVVGCMRCSCGGTLRPPRLRGTASEMVVFQRQRVWNTGASSNACTSTSRAVAGWR